DYLHMEEDYWKNGGYPGMSLRAGNQLDRRVVSSNYLQQWMVVRGADPERIQVCYTNIDPDEWDPSRYRSYELREDLRIPPDTPVVLFGGRVVDQKRPLVMGQIAKQ